MKLYPHMTLQLIVIALTLGFFSPGTVYAAEWDAQWIWQNDQPEQQTSFQIDYDTQIQNQASGFIFGAKAQTESNCFLWQLSSVTGPVFLRLHQSHNGVYTLLDELNVSNIIRDPLGQIHVTIKVKNGTVTTALNGQQVDSRYLGSALVPGEIGFREDSMWEQAQFSNVCIKDSDGQIMQTEDFASTAVYGKDARNHTLTLGNKTLFLPTQTNTQRMDTWMNLRKTFDLSEIPSTLPAKIAADSKYWLTINGKLVVFEGGLKRGPTPEDTWYDTVDIAPYLQTGQNTIAVLVHYFGVDGFSHNSSGQAGFLFEAKNGNTQIVSDSTWKVKKNTAYIPSINSDEMPNFRLSESNLNYDARKDTSGDATGTDYDDSSWDNAITLGRAGSSPWNALCERTIPQFKNSGLLNYENADAYSAYTDVSTEHQTQIVMELPYDAQITPALTVDAPVGLEIKMRTNTYNDPSVNENSIQASYITKEGEQSFEAYNWMSGEQVIYTIPAGVKILSLQYRETGYDTHVAGTFNSDNAFMNKLWQQSARTVMVNMRDNFMDCPDQERAAWSSDFTTDMKIMFYALDRNADALYKKSIVTTANWIQPNGVLQTVVPNGNYSTELPIQNLTTIAGVSDYYLYTADNDTLRQIYPAFKNYLSLYNLGSDGLVIHRSGGWDWADHGDNIDMAPIENAWYYMALKSGKEMAEVLGKSTDIGFYETRMKSIESHYNQAFWTASGYYHSTGNGQPDDRANAMAVVAGLADSGKYPTITTVLTNHKNASPFMEKYVLDALSQMGEMTTAQSRIEERYAIMTNSDQACSTLWEFWNKSQGSYNHGWSGGPLITMSKYMAGIRPVSPGYTTWEIAPQMGNLNQIDCTVPTLRGDITTHLEKSSTDDTQTFTMTVNVPEETTASAVIPCGKTQASTVQINDTLVYQNGQAADSASGVRYEKTESSAVYFTLQPGQYTIVRTESSFPDVRVQAHVENKGWLDPVTSGKPAGTSGQGLRMESLILNSVGDTDLGITCSAHVEDSGWRNDVPEGQVIGTTGEAKRLEALKIKLSDEASQKYDIYYRVHAQNIGWMNWAKNGEPAGTAGYAYRLEAVEIQIVSKGNLPPGTNPSNNTSLAFIQKESANIRTVHFDSQGADAIADQRLSIGTPISQPEDPVKDGYRFTGWFTDSSCITAWHFKDPVTQNMTLYAGWIEENTPDAGVSTHVENIGWMDFVQNGAIAGTSGRALRMEGLIFKSEGPVDLGISCSAHVQDYGWQHAVQEGMNAGTTGESKRLEAIKLTLSDFAAQNYDIYYRVHAQNIGWMAWTKNGKPAGTAGFAYRLEALQVRIVPKDGAVPDSNPPNAVSTPYLEK